MNLFELADQLVLPPPPTGPEGRVPGTVEGKYHYYLEWKLTADGSTVFEWIRDRVMDKLLAGETRISVRTVLSDCRDALKVEINDTYSPWIADDLIVRNPALLDVIERRKRHRPKR